MQSVLVIDDDCTFCKSIRAHLAYDGLSVECAPSNIAYYRRITSLPTLDALIIDINIKDDIAGYEIARFAHAVIPRIAVIYMIDSCLPRYSKPGGPGGGQQVKPVSLRELFDNLTRSIALWSGARD